MTDDRTTAEERDRRDCVQAELDQATAELRAEGIEVIAQAVLMGADEIVEQIHASEAAVFLPARAFTYGRVGPSGVFVPRAELDTVDWIVDGIARGRLRCDLYGIGREIKGVDVGWFLHMRLRVGLKHAPIYVWARDAPDEWIRWACRQYALVFPDFEHAFLLTGTMQQHPEGITVPGKIGRNDICPCGSGLKAKRCCLR